MKRHFFATLAALAALSGAQAANLDFTYNFDKAAPETLGYDKTETYDVAILLNNPSLTGTTVTGLSVALPAEGIANPTGWLSSELKLKRQNGRYVNVPDITTAAATVSDGTLTVTFAEPYVIPAEGVYVGYSFDVETLNGSTSAPVSVVPGTDENGLFLHSSRTKTRWNSQVADTGRVSAMTVSLQGSFPSAAAYILPGELSAAVDEPFTATVTLVNGGTQSVSSIEYSYKAGSWSGTGTAILSTPLPGGIARRTSLSVSFEGVPETGAFPLEVKVTKVNDTAADCAATEGKLEVFPFIPVNRPLVEEYTGLWCGYCPRGYVALELMKQKAGDLYIAAAYHNGDKMEFYGNTPNNPDSYPAGYFNRSVSTSFSKPYEDWQASREGMPEGEVTASVKWTDETKSALSATATTRFIRDYAKADYRLHFILVADELSDPTWLQNNYFSGKAIEDYPYMNNEIGRVFLNGPTNVPGLTFNDVALCTTDTEGFPASVPAAIEAGREYTFSYTFDLSDLENEVWRKNPDRLRVIAVLLDAGGRIVNSNSSPYPDGTPFVGVNAAETATDAAEIARYAIDGTRLAAPTPGINIIRCADGTVRKVLVK